MLLGYEYEILSEIALNFKKHRNGMFMFTKDEYRSHMYSDENLIYLNKLILAGFASFEGNLVKVNSHKWINCFCEILNSRISEIGFKYALEFDEDKNTIKVKKDEKSIMHFTPIFEEISLDTKVRESNFIYFVHPGSFNFHMFWMELINDINLLNMFVGYLENEFSSFNYHNIYTYSFFEGINEEALSELFNVSIPDYLKLNGWNVAESPFDLMQDVKKFLKRDSIKSYLISNVSNNILVVMHNEEIMFFQFRNGTLVYLENALGELDVLKRTLIKKISQYRQLSLFNKHKIIDNTRRLLQMITLIITPINLLILFGSTTGIEQLDKFTKNIWVIGVTAALLVLVLIGIVWLVVIPAYKISKFNWKLK